MSRIKILGVDPGLNITGYGMIEIAENENPQLFTYGHIRTNARKSLSERLHQIYSKLNDVINEHQPDFMAIEDLFYAENVKTAIIMGHARGAAIVAGMNNGVDVTEYTAREVKMSVVGNGAAAKSQVQFMVRNILGVKEKIEPDDASDALAVALCKWHRLGKDKKLGR
ncbi:MAG: crossover junction endodeoxyribonuclease RuvC [Calditrichaceae bacterium]